MQITCSKNVENMVMFALAIFVFMYVCLCPIFKKYVCVCFCDVYGTYRCICVCIYI